MCHMRGDRSGSEIDKGLRFRCDTGQGLNFFETEVSSLENECNYCKQGAWLAHSPFQAHNPGRKYAGGTLYYIRTSGRQKRQCHLGNSASSLASWPNHLLEEHSSQRKEKHPPGPWTREQKRVLCLGLPFQTPGAAAVG